MRLERDPATFNHYARLALLFGLALLSYRLLALYFEAPGLFFDEAYYYGWAQTPDWGYFSKPPMVAWLIALSTGLLGSSEFTVKLPAPLLFFITAWVVFLLANRLSGPRAGFMAYVVFFSMPWVGLESWFITTDAPLLLSWALCWYFFLRAQDQDRWHDWLLAGLFGGLGLLSKYTMGLFPIAVLFWLIWQRDLSVFRSIKFWSLVAVAGALFAPNLWWNHQHGWPSFIHTFDLAGVESNRQPNPIEFFVGQFAVFGPIAFALLLTYLHPQRASAHKLAIVLCFVPLLLFVAQSLRSNVFLNWAGMAYVAGAVLVGIRMAPLRRWVIASALTINLVLAVGFYHYSSWASLLNITLTTQTTPFARVEGWREFGLHTRTLMAAHPDHITIAQSRNINSYLSFYLDQAEQVVRTIEPQTPVRDHYQLKYVASADERLAIFISQRPLSETRLEQLASRHELIDTLEIPLYDTVRRFYFYRLER